MGRACDRIGPRQAMIICFTLSLASLLWLLKAREMWALYIFSVAIGFANGGNTAADIPLVARLFGLKSIGSIAGVSSCAFSVGVAFGPSLAGYVFDVTGSYQTAFLICAMFSALGIVLTALQRPTLGLQIKL
jgi:MFS family permease